MIPSCYCWSDSTTVLQGIRSSYERQEVYGAHPAAEVLDAVDLSHSKLQKVCQQTSRHWNKCDQHQRHQQK